MESALSAPAVDHSSSGARMMGARMSDHDVKMLGALGEGRLQKRLMEALCKKPLRCPPIENIRYDDLNGHNMPYADVDIAKSEVKQALDPIAHVDGMFDELVRKFRTEVDRAGGDWGQTMAGPKYEPKVIVSSPEDAFGRPGTWRIGIKWNVNFGGGKPTRPLSVPWIGPA